MSNLLGNSLVIVTMILLCYSLNCFSIKPTSPWVMRAGHFKSQPYSGQAAIRNSICSRFAVSSSFDDESYYDMLDMDKKVDQELSDQLFTEWSIDEDADEGDVKENSKSIIKIDQSRKKMWPIWDDFMEAEFGDMDEEVGMDDKWILEMRDIVELKRGLAIWSKKSDEDIQREMKKLAASKMLKVPEAIASIIRCVFLEKTHTMKEMRKENELGVIEFRKWMIEQKKKTKKDPLPIAKVEVSKRWIMQHPIKFGQGSIASASVIMDELRIPPLGVQFESDKSQLSSKAFMAGRDSSFSPPNSRSPSGAPTPAPIVTSSMINWESSEVPTADVDNESPVIPLETSFKIDDVEMCLCVANGAEDDYYVVL